MRQFLPLYSIFLVSVALAAVSPATAQSNPAHPPRQDGVQNLAGESNRVTNPSAAAQGAHGGTAAQNPATATAHQRPFPPLKPDEQQHLDQLLAYWQQRSAKVKTYSCKFVRWEYDMTFGPRNPNIARTQAEGIIRYSSPDKGEFNVLRLGVYQQPTNQNQRPYDMKAVEHEEHWICDGSSVFELNPKKKQLIERKLPPEMRGRQIADGPLPFMFGATREKLQARYWMREQVPPKERPNEYWVWAYPRTRADAADFQKIRVILDQETFLPNALEVFPPNYDQKLNPSRTVYLFKDRKINDPLHRGQEFLGRFISPKPPRGWKVVVENYDHLSDAQVADRRVREPDPGPASRGRQ